MLPDPLVPATGLLYLFTTHITRGKITAAVVVVLVGVAVLGFWLMRRRRTSS